MFRCGFVGMVYYYLLLVLRSKVFFYGFSFISLVFGGLGLG